MTESFYDIAVNYFNKNNYPEVSPIDFYKDIFDNGERFEELGKQEKTIHKYNPIALIHHKEKPEAEFESAKAFVDIFEEELFTKITTKRRILTNGLPQLQELLKTDDFVTITPFSYIGKNRSRKNVRYMYAITFDLDGVETEERLNNLVFFCTNPIDNRILCPNYIVISGTDGLHLYYKLDTPVNCFPDFINEMNEWKNFATSYIWNVKTTKYVKTFEQNIQFEPILQPFRMVGGVTKDFKKTGHRTRAFKLTDHRYTIKEMTDHYCKANKKTITPNYVASMTLEEAEQKYPEWFARRHEKPLMSRGWTCKVDLYNWWLKRLSADSNLVQEGHRYYSIGCLASYAKKCGISFEQAKKDAYSLFDYFESLTVRKENHFYTSDIDKALLWYNNELAHRMSIDSIVHFSNIPIEKNRRNFRKRNKHLKIARLARDMKHEDDDVDWRTKSRNSGKQEIVRQWRTEHRDGSKYQCCKELNLSKPTVYKWWDYTDEEAEK